MGKFLHELQRRNVFRMVAAYLGGAWLTFEVVSGIEQAAGLPAWADSITLILIISAFPIVLFVAWAFELTPDGIVRTQRADGETEAKGPRWLDLVVLGVIVLFAGLIAWQQFGRLPESALTGDDVSVVTPSSTDGARTDNEAEEAPEALSVAVLPFLAFTDDQNDSYFADGLTEEILNSLAAVPELLVTSRTSAFQFRGTDLPSIPEIARSLGVAHVMEGSVRRAGDQVRITVQLIRASDDRHLWSQTYDRSMEDVFQIQEDIAENVAAVLNIVLNDDQRQSMRASGTRNFDAYIAYQQGRELWNRSHEEDDGDQALAAADPYFETATNLAPDFSEAWLMRSDWYAHQMVDLAMENPPDLEAIEVARSEQTRLLEQAWQTADTASRRSIVETNEILFSDNWAKARAEMNIALAADECANDNWLQLFVVLYDDLDRRMDYARQQVVCDPLNPIMLTLLADTHIARGEYEAAQQVAVQLNEMGHLFEAEVVGFEALLGLGLEEEAREMLEPDWEWESLRLSARFDSPEVVRATLQPFLSDEGSWFDLVIAALMGDRETANAIAAEIDARPIPVITLLEAIMACRCGAPFDLEATPNFAMLMAQSGMTWPPAGDSGFPRVPSDPVQEQPTEIVED